MSWDDPNLQNRFSQESYRKILEWCRSGNPDIQICALIELGETLSYGNDELLGDFPLREMTVQMVRFLKDKNFEFLQENAAQCISRFLECHTCSTRTLIENGALEVIRDLLNSCPSVPILLNLIHSCFIISEYRPADLGAVVGIKPLLNTFNFVGLVHQKTISKSISFMTSRSYYDSYIESIDTLISLMHLGDPTIAQNCLNASINIISQAPIETFTSKSSTTIKTLCDLLPNLQDNNQIQQIVRFLYRISSNPEAGRAIIDTGFDFSSLIGSTIIDIVDYEYEDENQNDDADDNNESATNDAGNDENNDENETNTDRSNNDNDNIEDPPEPKNPYSNKNLSPEVITMAYQTILNLLPPPQINGNGMWDTKRKPPSNTQEFAQRIQPILINVLLKTFEINVLALVALTQAIKFDKKYTVSDELVHSLCGFTQQQNILPYILYFVDSCPKPQNTQIFNKSGLMHLLINKRPNQNHHLYSYYENIIKKLTHGKTSNIKNNAFPFKTYNSIWTLIENLKETSSYDLLQDGFFIHMQNLFDKFIKSQNEINAKKPSMYELQPLIENLTELLHFLPIQRVFDPYGNSIFELNGNRPPVFISIKRDGNYDDDLSSNRRRRRHRSDSDNNDDDDDDNDDYEEELNNDYDGSENLNDIHRARYTQKNCVIFTEAYYNYEMLHIPDISITNNWRKSGRLSQIITPPQNLTNVTFTELAIYHRVFQSERYKKCIFSIDGKQQIYPYDPLFRTIEMYKNQLLGQNSDNNSDDINPQRYSLIKLTDCGSDYDDKLDDKLSVLTVPTNLIDPQMKKVLDFMKYLKLSIFPLWSTAKQNSPTLTKTSSSSSFLSFRNHKFESRLILFLNSPYLTVTCNTPAVQIIANYPFLFSYEAKMYVYKTTTLSYISALKNTIKLKNLLHHQHGRLISRTSNNSGGIGGNSNSSFNDHSTHIKVHLSREKIFDDGCILLKSLGHPFFLFDISFEGEEGIGIGPTQEFFTLMGLEFAKSKHKMWRNDHNGNESADGEAYATSKIGLYPMVGASLSLFELLGKFCGKAVEMGYLVPIPFSRPFFKVFAGEDVTMEEIDEQLAKSIKSSTPEILDGFTFEYPGTEFEMKKNGSNISINSKNIDEYKSLVEQYTINKEAVEAFKNGFHSIVSPGIDNIFDADEFKRLISGDDTNASANSLTKSDFRDNVIISHGYTKNSPQIEQLFEILESFSRDQKALFIRFVTGCERLPVGGLKNLSPKLTIARKVPEVKDQNPDDLLPSVMTCTNYFKLPSYSSKEIMKEKILLAISEGQGAFLLT